MDRIDAKTKKGFETLVEETRKEAIRIMKVEMPKKLVELNMMSAVNDEIMENMEPFLEKIDILAPVVPSNERICLLLEKVKRELWDMINSIITVKFYIKLNQPRKEDGNTFGVEVQNEIIHDLNEAQGVARQMLSDMVSYFTTRASIVASSRKYPHVADYANGVSANDNKEIMVLTQAIVDTRNQYAVLYDRMMKNFDKITKPTIMNAGLKWDSMY